MRSLLLFMRLPNEYSTIGERLPIKEQRARQPAGPDPLDVIMTDALRELSAEWGIELLGDGSDPS